jgi:oxygen-independent coproporphyrinogen-3 oxidase
VNCAHLYVHVPFCSRRCVYCDFSIAVRPVVPVEDYLDGIRSELAQIGEAELKLDTLYLGGGTPSKLGGDGISALVDLIREFATLNPEAEITIEANPEDVSRDNATAWANAGVNRISLGGQSFHPTVLEWMRRTHTANQISDAFNNARAAGFKNISLDLIFALPNEIERSWIDDLDKALSLEPAHVSLYGLTIEPETPLARWTTQRRITGVPEDRYAEEFLLAHERLGQSGFDHYEVSNFAQPGFKSRHNSAYWTGAPYVGIGPSAHSFDGIARRWNIKPYTEWLGAVRSGRSALAGQERLDSQNTATERVYLGLRTDLGYTMSPSDRMAVEQWERAGWAVIDGNLVRLKPEGWLRLDSLAAGLTGS